MQEQGGMGGGHDLSGPGWWTVWVRWMAVKHGGKLLWCKRERERDRSRYVQHFVWIQRSARMYVNKQSNCVTDLASKQCDPILHSLAFRFKHQNHVTSLHFLCDRTSWRLICTMVLNLLLEKQDCYPIWQDLYRFLTRLYSPMEWQWKHPLNSARFASSIALRQRISGSFLAAEQKLYKTQTPTSLGM